MSSVFHGAITVSIFGQSHAPGIGVVVDGLPAGEKIDLDELQAFLTRRARICLQIPPAMHRGAVSRPEKCPPPATSCQPPYFIWAVKSAWPGRGMSRRLE